MTRKKDMKKELHTVKGVIILRYKEIERCCRGDVTSLVDKKSPLTVCGTLPNAHSCLALLPDTALTRLLMILSDLHKRNVRS